MSFSEIVDALLHQNGEGEVSVIEDKLTRDERIRLEAIAQTNARTMGRMVPRQEFFLWVGSIEHYIRNGGPIPDATE